MDTNPSSIEEILRQWGFPELIQKFKDEEIDLDTLIDCKIDEKMIAKAGPRTRFLRLRDAWKESLNHREFPLWYFNVNSAELGTSTLDGNGVSIENIETDIENQSAIGKESGTIEVEDAQVAKKGHLLTQQAPNTPEVQPVEDFGRPGLKEGELAGSSSTPATDNQKWNRNCTNPVSQYLRKNVKVAAVLAKYDARTIESDDRQKLADAIVVGEMNGDTEKVIDPKRFVSLAAEIRELLPNENVYVYYIPRRVNRGINVAPKGKLYNKYNSICKKLREAGLRKRKQVDSNEDEVICTDNDDLVWLSTRTEPWETVIEKWIATAELRLSGLQKSVDEEHKPTKKKKRTEQQRDSVSDYMNKYGALRQADGFGLLELDFAHLFPECGLRLVTRWEAFTRTVRALSNDCELLSEVSIFHAFAKLFDPVLLTTKGKRKQRSTKVEIIEGFLLHIKVIDDLNPTLDRMREKARELKRTFQPIPVVIGLTESEISASYVVIDTVFYKVDTPLRAVDIAFKSYHALHAQYPAQSEGPWLLLQQAVYGIKTQSDNIIPRVHELIQAFEI